MGKSVYARHVFVALLVALALCSTATAHGRDAHWVATWAAGDLPPRGLALAESGFTDQTVRQYVPTSAGGTRVRLRLTNAFGSRPLRIDEVALALPHGPGGIDPATSRAVTFAGSRSVLVPPGARVLSDPMDMVIRPNSKVAVTIYVAEATGPATFHRQSRELSYVSAGGNHVHDPSAAAFTTSLESWFLIDGLSVLGPRGSSAVVTLGDSITDGDGATIGTDRRWPNVLSRRLAGARPWWARSTSVVNAGIGANRILNDSIWGGPNAIARFDRDVIAQQGVRDVILLEGVNDIGFGNFGPLPPPISDYLAPFTNVSAQEVIAGLEQLIEQAHAADLRILGGTILPYKGSFYWAPEGEAKRVAVNTWIRKQGDFDGVIDFDAVIRDPADPSVLRPAYDTGDHLHPNDAGYAAMGNAIRLSCLSLGRPDREPGSRRAACTVK